MAVVTGVLRQGTQVAVRARDFTWLGDEPTGAGGTNTGPTPYEILLGALAACITITLRLYADHKGIPLEEVRVEGPLRFQPLELTLEVPRPAVGQCGYGDGFFQEGDVLPLGGVQIRDVGDR